MRRVIAAASGCLMLASAAAAQEGVRLDAATMLRAAEIAQAAGEFDDARALLSALTGDVDPEVRAEARFRLGMLLAGERRFADAATQFRALLDERPAAARVRLELARVLAAMGDDSGARRAIRQAQAQGLTDDVAVVVDQFAAALRSPKRFGGSIQLAVVPDTNINRATDARTLDTVIAPLTLSRDARARSGLGLRTSAQGYARIEVAERLALFPRLSASGSFYDRGSFNDVSASALIGLEWRSGRDRIVPAVGPTWRWYGQRLYARTDTAALDWLHPIGRRTQLVASGSAARARYERNRAQNGGLFDVNLGIERALSARSGIAVGIGATRQTARDPGYALVAGTLTGSGWRDAGRTTVFASASVRRTEGDARFLLFPDRRREWLIQASIGATFRALAVKGFAPLARIGVERNRSTVGLYSYRRLVVDLGIARAF